MGSSCYTSAQVLAHATWLLHLLQTLADNLVYILAETLHSCYALELSHHHPLPLLVILPEGGEGSCNPAGHLVVDLVHLQSHRTARETLSFR